MDDGDSARLTGRQQCRPSKRGTEDVEFRNRALVDPYGSASPSDLSVPPMRTILLLMLAALAGGCSAPLAPARSAESDPPPALRIERPDSLGGRATGGALALVRAQVGGRDGLFLLDTGASRTVLAPAFARSLGVAAVGNVQGTDAGGAVVSGSVLPPLTVAAATGPFHAEVAQPIVLDLPPLVALGLDGVVSPQTLLGTPGAGCVAVDFASASVVVDRSNTGACDANRPPDYAAPSADGLDRPTVRFSVQAPGSAAVPDQALVDTGDARTSIPVGTLAGAPTVGEARSVGVSGEVRTEALRGPVTVRIGTWSGRLDAVETQTAEGEGARLGMDVLGRGRIVLTADGAVRLWIED